MYVKLSLAFVSVALLAFIPFRQDEKITTRNYCTEIGRFDMLFYEDEISGTYVLLTKKSTGAIWGNLAGNKMTGKWVDGDGSGDIIITFNEDFTWFTTDYRSYENPTVWYRDQWHGSLRTTANSAFEVDGKRYKCE